MHRKYISFVLSVLCVIIFATMAMAAGKHVVDPNGKALRTHSPYPASAVCTTTTTTKGTIATVTVAGYSSLCWEASDSSNAAKRIKRHLNSNTAYMPGTGACNGLNKDTTTVAFKPYSAAAAAYTVCYDMEKGGTTP